MNIPLNIDWQQILLHWLNLAILTGGLYFLLYKPVKQFIAKREEHYQNLEKEAAGKLEEADRIKAQYQQKLDQADEELHQARAEAQKAVEKSAREQLAIAQTQAQEIVAKAQAQAEQTQDRALKASQRELKKLATEAVEMLAFHPDTDPFDQFLNLAEGGSAHEKR